MTLQSLKGAGQGFCDNNKKALVIKSVTMGGGDVQNCPKLCDVIYGLPLFFYQIISFIEFPFKVLFSLS